MLNVENIALKKSKSLCFASKEKVLKNDGIESNDENMINNNDETFSPHGSENQGMCFLDDSLNKNMPSKKWLCCLKKRASTLRCSEKQVLLKRI